MDDDVQYDDGQCPNCKRWGTLRFRDCTEFNCEDGFIDEHEDDPINYAPGEEFSTCQECRGTGIVRWCSGCGTDLTGKPWSECAQCGKQECECDSYHD